MAVFLYVPFLVIIKTSDMNLTLPEMGIYNNSYDNPMTQKKLRVA